MVHKKANGVRRLQHFIFVTIQHCVRKVSCPVRGTMTKVLLPRMRDNWMNHGPFPLSKPKDLHNFRLINTGASGSFLICMYIAESFWLFYFWLSISINVRDAFQKVERLFVVNLGCGVFKTATFGFPLSLYEEYAITVQQGFDVITHVL